MSKDFDFPLDVMRILAVCDEHHLFLTPEGAAEVWEAFSFWMDAGWMRLPDSDDEVWIDVVRGVQELVKP